MATFAKVARLDNHVRVVYTVSFASMHIIHMTDHSSEEPLDNTSIYTTVLN